MEDTWEGVVVGKKRILLDGSNMYRRLRIRTADGAERRVRVPRDLWKALDVGDTVVKRPGEAPAKG
ncbi:hypothetical protein P0W64_17395 [Tsukamurella sp. 8F]|uniref:DUF7489 domain-containing protein n=1 Tax=unclassified Tsukamurella TaxID=2633480 RepID=UPI0023BA07EF|nr:MULTISPECIES: hypothetical protein [unclassified Tsukamurella]MDF0531354.1 hypothetical protein [Tsukamurella sp. 8J]MDF0588560.1 hypothetical protein [Tsukamurella sp. 8F]